MGRCGEIRGHRAIPFFLPLGEGHFSRRVQFVNAGIVHQDVNAAKGAQHGGHQLLGSGGNGQVRGEQRVPGAGQFRQGRLRRGAVLMEMHRHAHLARRELPGDRPADPAGGAGDQGYGMKCGGHRMNSSCAMRRQLAKMMISHTTMQFR